MEDYKKEKKGKRLFVLKIYCYVVPANKVFGFFTQNEINRAGVDSRSEIAWELDNVLKNDFS